MSTEGWFKIIELIMEFFIHVGESKTISIDGLVGIFNKDAILSNSDNEGVFPELFDDDELEHYKDSRSVLLYFDGYFVFSKIKPGTIVNRRKGFLKELSKFKIKKEIY